MLAGIAIGGTLARAPQNIAAEHGGAFFTRPVYLAAYGPPNEVLAAEGFGLFIYNPEGKGSIEFRGFSKLGKLSNGVQAAQGFAEHGLLATCGPFVPGEGPCVLILSSDGSLTLLHGFDPGKGTFARTDPAGKCVSPEAKGGSWRLLSLNKDALLIDQTAGVVLKNDGRGHFSGHTLSGALPSWARIESDGARLAGIDGEGQVWEGSVSGSFKFEEKQSLLKLDPGSGLAFGHFLSKGSAPDLLAGQELLPGGDPKKAVDLPELAPSAEAADDAYWLACDLTGSGKDELVRVRRSQERFTANDVYVQYEPDEAGFADSSNDGLLDAWKMGEIKPGGLDLAAMGCSPFHKDVIVEVQRMPDVSLDHVKAEMQKVVAYFASLPYLNLDGERGVAMHVIYREPINKEDVGKSWQSLGDIYHPASHRGITHWMVVYHGGGGQSDIMFDRGSCGDAAMSAVFTHELGHQLGLDHNGFFPGGGCPIYPSLMNYPYNYQLDGKRQDVGYSSGALAGVTLVPSHLPKYLPFPPSKLEFISGPPYRFRIKPAPDGKGTLVDWNWDGNFKEKTVAADINYGYGTTAGQRYTIGKTYTAAAPAAAGKNLLLFTGDLPKDAPLPKGDAAEPCPSLCEARPGRLRMRVWKGPGGDAWSKPADVEPSGVIGDPSAVSADGAAWVAYPTLSGVKIARADATGSNASPAIPNTAKCQVTLAKLGTSLALILWRGGDQPLALQPVQLRGGHALPAGAPITLPFSSLTPVGTAEGPQSHGTPTIWVADTEKQDNHRTYRWRIRQIAVDKGQATQLSSEWVGGEKGGESTHSRLNALWEPNRALGPEGELYVFGGGGGYTQDSTWSCGYVSMRIGEKDVNGGWLTRRYYDEWTQSRSCPGVCWFRGDIFYAHRWYGGNDASNDGLFVAFSGRGIQSEPMGDFNDLSFIRDFGLHRSISWVSR